MKRFSVLVFFVLFSLPSFGQNIISIAKPSRTKGNYIPDTRKARLNALQDLKIDLGNKINNADSDSSQIWTDSLSQLEVTESEIAETAIEERIEELNNTSPVKLIANGGISNLEEINAAAGNLSLGFMFRLSRFKRIGQSNWIDPHFLYLMFNTRTSSSVDTASIHKTFIFPELNKRDFVLGYLLHLENNNWGIEPVFEFSLNRYSDSARNNTFHSQSFLIGSKFYKAFSFRVNDDTLSATAPLFSYYSLINVDPKDFDSYRNVMKDQHAHPPFYSFGLQAQIQIDKIAMFCNMKYIMNKEGQVSSNDLRRFVYTIGTMISL